MLPCIPVCFVLIFELLWCIQFWSCLLFVQCIVPSPHCCAQLQLSINNENMQGLLAQVSAALPEALLRFRELDFAFEFAVWVFSIKLHESILSAVPLSWDTWPRITPVCSRIQKGLSRLPVPSHCLLKCRNKSEPCVEHRRKYWYPKWWGRKVSHQLTD